MAADALALQGVNQDGTSLGNATVSGARVDVQNQEAGSSDSTRPTACPVVRVATSTVSVRWCGCGLRRLLAGVSVDFNSIAGTASAGGPRQPRGTRYRFGGCELGVVDGSQGSLHAGDDKTVRASADRAAMPGAVRRRGRCVGGDQWPGREPGLGRGHRRRGGVGCVRCEGRCQGLNGTNVQASGFTGGSSDAWMMARADHAGLTGVDHELLKASSASVNGASLGWNARETPRSRPVTSPPQMSRRGTSRRRT